jgi:hypothetical protein
MNLHGIVSSYVGAVNPLIPVTVRISTEPSEPSAAGIRTPQYATPGAFTGSMLGAVLTASAVSAGFLQSGQTITGAGVAAGTLITAQLTGTEGGVGTYSISKGQTIASEAMTSELVLLAQIQPMSWRDLQQVEGLNLNGTRRKFYLRGVTDGVNRIKSKGGDLIIVASGVNIGTWLIAQVLEQFPDWCSVAATEQND